MQEKKEKPNYYAIIPSFVRYDLDLSPNTKLMYGEITALSNKNGYCNAGNEYFAGLYEVHKMTISKWISQLKSKGYINVDLIYKKGTKSIEERRIIINDIPISKKVDTYKSNEIYPISEKVDTYKRNEIYPISEKTEDNNTSINTTSNNNIPPISPLDEIELVSTLEIQFNKFWELYPKKKSKQEAFKSFTKINLNKEMFNLIIKQLELFKQTKDWKKEKGQFIPYPATWLNQKRWEDEINEDDIKEITTKDIADKYDWSDF